MIVKPGTSGTATSFSNCEGYAYGSSIPDLSDQLGRGGKGRQTCTSCGDACLAQDMVKDLTQCVRLNLDCADVCNITGRIATRRTGSDDELIRRMLLTCAAACRLCGDECERHASQHEHCRICAEACRRCMQACQEVGRSMAH